MARVRLKNRESFRNLMRKLALFAALFFAFGFGLALAQEAKPSAGIPVAVKGDVQGNFIRLVFSGNGLPQATVSESNTDSLKIVFAKPVALSQTGALAGISPGTSIVADPTVPGTFTIKTGPMARHRTLALGNRLFIDLFTSQAPKMAQASAPVPAKPTETKADAKAPEFKTEPKVEPVMKAAEKRAQPQPDAVREAKAEPAAGESAVATPSPPSGALAAAIAAAKAAAGKMTAAVKPEPKAEPAKTQPAKTQPAKTEVAKEVEAARAASAPDSPAASTSLVTDNAPKAAPETKTESKPEAKTEAAATSAPETAAAPAAVTATAETQQKPFDGSALITIGSTQGLALAAFMREGYLWIVLSQEQLTVPPQVSGPSAGALGPMQAVKIDGGSAWRVKLPQGAYVRPQGAGLIWRLYIEGRKPELRTSAAERDFSDTSGGPVVHIPLNDAVSALRVPDPTMGDDLAVITVGRAENRLIDSDRYVDFDLIPAIVGVVIRPKSDGLRISVLPSEVVIARQGGLRLSAGGPREEAAVAGSAAKDAVTPQGKAPVTIFSFKDWALGGPKQFIDMRHSVDEKVATAPDDRKLTELINGAKFMLGQGLAPEATGFLAMAQSFMPDLKSSAEFQAISGAVSALKGDNDDALAAFSSPGLETYDDIAMWKAYTLARSGLLPEAQKAMPADAQAILAAYPARLQAQLLPPLIEAVLARGDVNVADKMIGAFDKASGESLTLGRDDAIAYYRGRVAQLRGDNDAASDYYRQAAEGLQGPYPVRATLALVERGLTNKTISREDAIRKLERFRYGWRGDNLESAVLERLGLIYVTGGEQRRGLTILRDAATQTQDPAERQQLVAVMQKAFRELFSGKTREKMSPLEAAAVAAEFNELMPAGADGEAIKMTIADQMVQVDLLERAADMIEPMVVNTANVGDAVHYAQRAAAIRVLNDQPNDALKIIDKALSRPDAQGTKAVSEGDLRRFALLRAKAKAQLKRPDDALAELNGLPEDAESLKLTADIAWGAQRWAVAADAFDRLVKAQNLSATRPPTHAQAQLVLNEALALNLSGQSDRLESIRVAYGDIMRRSDLNQPFQLVTRTAQEATLADRETLLNLVSEVDMFKDVLKSYETPAAPATPAAATAPAKK
jgi:hypothetical protein